MYQTLAPGRLSLELLDAYWATPPIAWTAVGPSGAWVVSENAASFHTLRRVLVDKAHAVASGGGGAFVQSIAGLHIAEGERMLYVGDLDAEGLAIPHRAGITAELFGLPSPQPFRNSGHCSSYSLMSAGNPPCRCRLKSQPNSAPGSETERSQWKFSASSRRVCESRRRLTADRLRALSMTELIATRSRKRLSKRVTNSPAPAERDGVPWTGRHAQCLLNDTGWTRRRCHAPSSNP